MVLIAEHQVGNLIERLVITRAYRQTSFLAQLLFFHCNSKELVEILINVPEEGVEEFFLCCVGIILENIKTAVL